jgi:hypothetical protein
MQQLRFTHTPKPHIRLPGGNGIASELHMVVLIPGGLILVSITFTSFPPFCHRRANYTHHEMGFFTLFHLPVGCVWLLSGNDRVHALFVYYSIYLKTKLSVKQQKQQTMI